jgi:hypothetical protein
MLRSLIRRLFPEKSREPFSMVLLARQPYAPTNELLSAAGERAFKVPFDGTDDMHIVSVSSAAIFVKAGIYLFSVFPKWGAYFAKTAEDDVESGAAMIPDTQRPFWREQRAWYAYNLMNESIGEAEATRILSLLLFELLDDRCCGIWIPHLGRFLPNDGTARASLARWSLGENIPSAVS